MPKAKQAPLPPISFEEAIDILLNTPPKDKKHSSTRKPKK